MVKFLSSRAAAPAIAIIVLIASTCLLSYDIALWNKACGTEVRMYDLWTGWALIVGHLSVPFKVGAFLALIVPALLARSPRARNVMTVLMLALLACVFLCLSDISWWDYVSNCYTGGHENAPGDGVAFYVVLPGMLVAALNAGVVAIDWIAWIFQVAIDRLREAS